MDRRVKFQLGGKLEDIPLEIKANGYITRESGKVETKYSGSVSAVVSEIKSRSIDHEKEYVKKLENALQKVSGQTTGTWPISVKMNLNPAPPEDELETVSVEVRGSLFTQLHNIFGSNTLGIQLIMGMSDPGHSSKSIQTEEMKIFRDPRDNSGYCKNPKIIFPRSFAERLRQEDAIQYKTGLVIFLFPVDDYIHSDKEDDSFSICKKIYSKHLHPDLEIKACDGTRIPAHKCFLAAHSDVLCTMFERGLEDSKTSCSSLAMFEMSPEGVKALLAYIYTGSIRAAVGQCEIAFELLRAAHKYNIKPLEIQIKDLLMARSENWYGTDTALRLFAFVRNIEDWTVIKDKVVRVLKAKHKEVFVSKAFKQLFHGDLAAAMELCSLSHGTYIHCL